MIQNEVRGQPVSLLADETSDVSRHEQIAVVIRYIPRGQVHPVERFIALKRLKKTNAETIFEILDEILRDMNILWEHVEAVCFDGASPMSGPFTGVQARCKEKKSSILYVHCYAHCLNLALVSACANHKENIKVFDFFGVIQSIYNFIEGSPKRHAVFEQLMQTVNTKLKTLKSLSETRWACRSEAVSAIQSQFDTVVQAIQESVRDSTDARAKSKGNGVLYQMRSFDFVMCLEMMHPILQLIVKVNKTLQSPDIDLCQAMEEVSCLALAMEELRISTDVFENMFSRAEDTCKRLVIDIPAPKKRNVSVRLDNNPDSSYVVKSKKDEFRIFVFYPILDKMIQSLNDRFSQETKGMICAVGKVISLGLGENKIEPTDFRYLSSQFNVDTSELEAEIRILRMKTSDNFPPSNAADWLEWLSKHNRGTTYTNFKQLMQKFSTIPVTSCTCERTFSKLSIVKTKLRSVMQQERLEDLMFPFVEQEIAESLDFDSVIDEFKGMVPFERRMTL